MTDERRSARARPSSWDFGPLPVSGLKCPSSEKRQIGQTVSLRSILKLSPVHEENPMKLNTTLFLNIHGSATAPNSASPYANYNTGLFYKGTFNNAQGVYSLGFYDNHLLFRLNQRDGEVTGGTRLAARRTSSA